MAHFSITLSFLCFFLLFDASSYASKVVEVNAICHQTTDPSFCLGILNSKSSGTKGADLITLANYTISVTRSSINTTINLIKSLIAQSADGSKAKEHYQSCLAHFSYEDGALSEIDYCEKMLESGDYQGVNVAASGVIAEISYCISGDSPSDPPYQDHSVLPKYANFLDHVLDIILVISNYLMQNN